MRQTALWLLLGLGAAEAQPRIINVHEHIESVEQADRLLAAMDANGIAKTVLMGSSQVTITLSQRRGFARWEWNNEQILDIVDLHPDRFEAWVTLDPMDPDKLQKLEDWVAAGATGLKLYSGQGVREQRPGKGPYFFHEVALDHPDMLPVYAYAEETGLPICFHINPGPTAPGFAEEFATVLTLFPDLKVNAPHFMLSSIRASRLKTFLRAFPNLHTDVSFGQDQFLIPGLKRISRSPGKFRKLIRAFPDRFMWGTDVVVTRAGMKSPDFVTVRVRAYLDMLSKDTYTTPLVPDRPLRGLALKPEEVERILWRNYEAFSKSRPRGTKTGEVDWTVVGVPLTLRDLGTFVPPARKDPEKIGLSSGH